MSRATLSGFLIAGAAIASACPTYGQVGADAARRALIEEARGASLAGDHARAVELATRAAGVRATPSLRYFLAREHLSLGHAVEALTLAGDCAARARIDESIPDRVELVARCEAIAAEADRGVARLTVRVATPAPDGLEITVAGLPLASALHNVPVPMAPGVVEVTARATVRAPFRATRTLVAGAHADVFVELSSEPPATAEPAPAPSPVVPAAPRPGPHPPTRSRLADAGPWVVGGAGLAALVTAGVLGTIALDARTDRDAACPSTSDCDPVAAAAHDGRYRDLAVGANVAVGLGSALVVGAATWWIIARVAGRHTARVSPAVGGVALRW